MADPAVATLQRVEIEVVSMFRRWRVRHSYPKPIVDLVVRMEPIYGAVTLSGWLDIPTSDIYRWRAENRCGSPPSDKSAADIEMFETLVANCAQLGLRVASNAQTRNERFIAPTSGSVHAIADGRTESQSPAHPDGWEKPGDSQIASNVARLSGSPVQSRAGRRYVFDACKERTVRGVRKRVELARQTVDTQYFLDLDCRTLAETAGMSLHHFIRVFGDVFGMSPHQYLLRARVAAAKRLLFVSAEPIDVIAAGVGFQSGSSLNRAFKRIEGSSVSTYCKTLEKSRIDPRRPEPLPLAVAQGKEHAVQYQGA